MAKGSQACERTIAAILHGCSYSLSGTIARSFTMLKIWLCVHLFNALPKPK